MKAYHLQIWILLPLLFISVKSIGQEWANSWGGPYLKQSGQDIVALPNGHFMAAGRAIEGSYDGFGFFTPSEADIFLLEINPQGDTVRSIFIRNRTLGTLELVSVLETTTDNGFILAGQLRDDAGDQDLLAIRIDGDGNKIWEKTYDFESREDFDEIIRTADGGFLLVGSYWGSMGNYTGFAMKIDEDGNQLWQIPLVWPGGQANSVLAAEELANGDLLIGGRGALSIGATDGGYLLKTDKDGEFIWIKEYAGVSFVNAIAATPGGAIFLGVFSDFNFITSEYEIMKTDEEGNTIWTQQYPSGGFDLSLFLKRVAPDKIAFVGNSLTYSENDLDVEDSYLYFGLLDTMGNLLSSLFYEPAESSEGLDNITLNSDGCLAAVGTSTDTAAGSEPRLFCTLLECFGPLSTVKPALAPARPGLRMSPNPAEGPCFIELPKGGQFPEGRLSIFDETGRMILSKTARMQRVEISTAGWPPGVYHLLWKTEKEAFSGQIVKQ